MERDKNKCVLCGSRERLEVDHIKPFALFPHLAIDINNGRVLCHECHKKTDTFGSQSRFKGDAPVHPLLAGDVVYKIESLPSCIEINGKNLGLEISYDPNNKRWAAGYKVKKLKLKAWGETVEKSIDNLFTILRRSALKDYDRNLTLFDEMCMPEKIQKVLRKGLYNYIEDLLGRGLTNDERKRIGELFRGSLKNYFDETFLNQS